MDGDDEFGDLYTDIGPEVGGGLSAEHLGTEVDADLGDEDDEALRLYGTSSSSLRTSIPDVPSLPSSSSQRRGVQPVLTSKEVDNDESLLYGLLYGQLNGGSVETPPNVESSPSLGISKRASSIPTMVQSENSLGDARLTAIGEKKLYNAFEENGSDPTGAARGTSSGMAVGGGGKAPTSVARDVETVDTTFHGRVDSRGLPPSEDNDSAMNVRRWQTQQANSPPGLAPNVPVQTGHVGGEEEEGGPNVRGDGEGGLTEQEDFEGGGEDWDSESEDDLNIVLNDEPPVYAGDRAADDADIGSSDDEEEDLVIVTGNEDGLPMEEQDWDDQTTPMDNLPGAVGATLSLGDRVPGGEDRGQGGKGSGGQGAGSGVPRFGYSGQGYHANHMQYKYVRPGAGGLSGTTTQGSPQAGAPIGRGAPGGAAGGWGQGRGGSGTGDWVGPSGRGSSGQRSQASGGMSAWGSSRGRPGGMEFNLPPTKTVFDVDIDSLEEKPWRKPGVDITDYFNFSFNETSWKQYCQQLAQLRLEATMQSKIRVYESGRSEQDYDPDLPPELAAATGMQDANGDPNLPQQRQQDFGLGTGSGRGRGVGRGRVIPQPGRAIQVEGGGGERRPSADVRRQRSRDSDAIVLVDATEDEPPAPTPGNDGSEEFQDEDAERGPTAPSEKERPFFRSGPPAPWEMEGHPGMWERKNGPIGMGPVNMVGPHRGSIMPAHRMEIDGPGGPFPAGPGMPMHQPGPNFGMFPGAPFGPPPVVRPGMVRQSAIYNPPRPVPPLQGPVRSPADDFPPLMVPFDYHEPSRHRTPPQLSPPRRTPPHAFPVDWDEELSNGSMANWNSRDGYNNHREPKDYDGGNGDWRADDLKKLGGNSYPLRRSRETDRSFPRDRSVEDQASPEARSENNNRSISRDRHVEDNDWDVNHIPRILKKQRVQQDVVDSRSKSGREEYNNRFNGSKGSILRSEELRAHTQSPVREDDILDEDRSQQERKPDRAHSKASQRKGLSIDEDSHGSQQKESGWHDSQDGEARDRRQLRDREELLRWNTKEDNLSQQRHGSRDHDVDRERHRDHQEKERHQLRKDKEDERVVGREDRSNRRHVEGHNWTSREQSRGPWEEGRSVSAERESDHIKERRKRDEERGKMKGRIEEYREPDGGRLKGRPDDARDVEGSGKGWLDDRREGDARPPQRRSEDMREAVEGRSKGRLADVGGAGDRREKGWLENSRESESRFKGRLDDTRQSEDRAKSQVEDAVIESDMKGRGRREDMRESEGGPRVRRDEIRDSEGRSRVRREDVRVNSEERTRVWIEDPRDNNGRGGKLRLEDRDAADTRIRGRPEDVRESERVKGRSETVRESERRMRRRSEDVRDNDGRVKGRLEDVRDVRESDVKLKGWPDVENEGRARRRERLEDPRERDSRLRSRLDDQRQSEVRATGRLAEHNELVDGRGKARLDEGALDSHRRGRRYEKLDAMQSSDGRRKYEEKSSSRSESNPGNWNRSAELWKGTTDEQRHKDKRKLEGNATSAIETYSDRNGAILVTGDEKTHATYTEGGSKKRRVDENETRAKFEKASTIDDTLGLAAASARHKERKAVGQKKAKEHFGRRPHGKDVTAHQLRVPKDEAILPAENGSSEEELADRRGRSKFERWNSRKIRNVYVAGGGESLRKWESSESLHEEPLSTSQRPDSERRQQSRAADQQRIREDRKENQGLITHSGRRHSDVEAKGGYNIVHGSGGRGDTVFPSAVVAHKDPSEKRKERIERMRLLQAEETAARRQKDDASVLQTGYVEEVKQERPARKRRWGTG